MATAKRRQAEEDLRATSDSIAETADRVADLEREKSDLDIDDPKVGKISTEVEALAGQIRTEAALERRLAAEVAASTEETIH